MGKSMRCDSDLWRRRWRQVTSLMVVTVTVLTRLQYAAEAAPSKVPSMFVFGDSLVDNGNNNYLSCLARANYYPYGCDFNGGSTGRFTNGRTIADMLGALLGLPYVPAFADPTTVGNRILGGVNYASAAAGILDESGQHYGQRYSLSQQVLNFKSTVNNGLTGLLGRDRLRQHLAKSMTLMVFGSNDYINNYLMPQVYTSSDNYTPPQFANIVLQRYARQILDLHAAGLRKFLIAGIGPLGCIPNQRASGQGPADRCVDRVNRMLGTFNEGLKALVDNLNRNHTDSIFLYGNTYKVVGDILNNPESYGFRVVDRGCCGLGRNQGQITCMPLQTPCPNRNEYVFWDAFHPTAACNAVIAWQAYKGPPSDCYPINVQQLAEI